MYKNSVYTIYIKISGQITVKLQTRSKPLEISICYYSFLFFFLFEYGRRHELAQRLCVEAMLIHPVSFQFQC